MSHSLDGGDAAIKLVVKDASGAVIPNAPISVSQERTGGKMSGKTDQSGSYTAANLDAGRYAIKIAAPGFVDKSVVVDLDRQETRYVTQSLEVAKPITDGHQGEVVEVEPLTSVVNPERLQELDIEYLPTGGGPLDQVMLKLSPTPKPRSGSFKRFFSTLGHMLGF